MAENCTIPRDSAVMGFGMPKSDQLCPPGPVTLTSMRRDAMPCVVICSVDGPSTAITAANRELLSLTDLEVGGERSGGLHKL